MNIQSEISSENTRMPQPGRTRLATAGMLGRFLWERRLWWMLPVVMTLLLLGGICLLAQSSALAPFIYSIF
ncbi:MAG TPA: DUF5989 family protein [Candidatus Ozemobacteraceae bacterium]|nr:DUF5989 family protein [Candidatus Ozemobacteraceae bacterium]